MGKAIDIAVIEDNQMFADGLRAWAADLPDLQIALWDCPPKCGHDAALVTWIKCSELPAKADRPERKGTE